MRIGVTVSVVGGGRIANLVERLRIRVAREFTLVGPRRAARDAANRDGTAHLEPANDGAVRFDHPRPRGV